MQGRTFIRIMIDNLFVNNVFAKTLLALVNFCKEQSYYNKKELKFLKKMPLIKSETNNTYNKPFVFNNDKASGVTYR